MTKNWKAGIGAAILSLSIVGAGAALTTTAHAQSTMAPAPYHSPGMRGEWGSNHSIHRVRMRLEKVIDSLQRDQHDYDGQRVQALQLLQQARQHLLLAEQWEKSHPNQ